MPESAVAEAIPAGAVDMSQVTSGPEPAMVQGPINESFSDLDTMLGGDPKQDTPTEDKAPPKAPDKTQPPKQDIKDKPQETPKDDKQPVDDKAEKPLPAPELRKAYQELKAKHKAIEAERDQYKKQIELYKPDTEERTRLSERLTNEEKRRTALEEELRMSAYERSAEFKERYFQPFVDAYEFGRGVAARFKALNPDGTVRQGTAEDFDRIVQIVDDEDAARVAEEMFGSTKAGVIMQHRSQVQALSNTQQRALEQAKTMIAERDKVRAEQQINHRKQLGDKWEKLNKTASEKYPDWFAPKEGDDKGNELLQKGYELADMAFSGNPAIPEDKLVEIHSAIRNRAAAFGRLTYQNKALSSRVSELEKELAAFKDSEPKAGEGSRVNGQNGHGDSLESKLSELDSLVS
jgi:hypothetical protein